MSLHPTTSTFWRSYGPLLSKKLHNFPLSQKLSFPLTHVAVTEKGKWRVLSYQSPSLLIKSLCPFSSSTHLPFLENLHTYLPPKERKKGRSFWHWKPFQDERRRQIQYKVMFGEAWWNARKLRRIKEENMKKMQQHDTILWKKEISANELISHTQNHDTTNIYCSYTVHNT